MALERATSDRRIYRRVHTCMHKLYLPKSHLSSVTSSKDLFMVTAFSRAAVTEKGMTFRTFLLTVIFRSVVHFERPASTADGRVTTCKDVVTCMSSNAE